MFTWHVYSIESSLEPVKPKKKVIEDENARDGEENDYNYIREHAALDEEHENNVQENLPQGETDAEPKETNSKEKSKSGKIETTIKTSIQSIHAVYSCIFHCVSTKYRDCFHAIIEDMPKLQRLRLYALVDVHLLSDRRSSEYPDLHTSKDVQTTTRLTTSFMFRLFYYSHMCRRGSAEYCGFSRHTRFGNNEECFDDNENREDNNEQNLLELKIDRVPKFLRSLSGLSDNLYDTDKAFENRHFYERDPNVKMRNDGALKMSIGPSS